MSTKGFSEQFALVGLAGVITLTLAAASADAAGTRGRAGGAQRGNSTHHVEGQRTANGHTRHDDWTNAKGKTATRDATVVNDRENGTRTRDVASQGPNGKTATREDVTQRTADGFTREAVRTNANGGTTTRDVNATFDPATKTFTKDVSVEHERATPPATP